jgi:hypothetical protein
MSMVFENLTKMFSGIWRKAKKQNMKKERKFGLNEFPRPLIIHNGGIIYNYCKIYSFTLKATLY